MTANQRAFYVIAGFAVFVAVTLILSEYSPGLALGIVGAAFGVLLLNNTSKVQGLLGQFSSALHPNAAG